MASCPFYQVDAFTGRPFAGGPAAVMVLEAFLSDERLLSIAAENNLAETAFLVPVSGEGWRLRWFTPSMEVPLCGHATLAAAHVLFTESMVPADRVVFDTLSGAMTVEKRADGWLEMDFPLISSRPSEVSEALCAALGARPIAARIGHYRLAQFATEEEVRDLNPDIARIARLEPEGEGLSGCIVCVAPGAMRSEAGDFDVVSRFFAPGAGVPEDPATGSAHCMIAPVYSQLLGREDLHCFQAFPGRGAVIRTRCVGDRVRLAGEAVTVIEGRFRI